MFDAGPVGIRTGDVVHTDPVVEQTAKIELALVFADRSQRGMFRPFAVPEHFEDVAVDVELYEATEPPRLYRRPFSSSQATLSSMFMFA